MASFSRRAHESASLPLVCASPPRPVTSRIPLRAQTEATTTAAGKDGAVTSSTESGGAWTRRDNLLDIEANIQRLWDERRAYEMDAPSPSEAVGERDKFFVTFPYPYMNGRLHLGHAFSITKAEFAARFMRLKGKKVLFPFAFHCTGMPISGAAMKLTKLLDERAAGGSKLEDEPIEDDQLGLDLDSSRSIEQDAEQSASGVFSGKKSKALAKSGDLDQYDIMVAMGIDDQEIPSFTDPQYWLKYFPPLAVQDLRRLGSAIDWRRSFITTDLNPYYDAFIRWQFLKLRGRYLENGKRESIYSIETQQPCADHDRAEGEGIKPLEYTLIKLEVLEPPEAWVPLLGSGDRVFMVAATLRPETMYGQTNCFVSPEGEYGLFRMSSGEVFVCSARSALNMCYQGLGELKANASGKLAPDCLLRVKGTDLVGLPLRAPLATYDVVYALPMFTISMSKGTGIVTSVPAEAPDDYACLRDWQTRENWRKQFNVKEEWCKPFDVVEILQIPDSDLGSASAPSICKRLKVDSHKERDKLAAAKKEVYTKGFYSGVLTIGPYAGRKVMDVKEAIKQDLVRQGQAARYFEPEGKVVSRSGDECVVALCDQWYLKYGDEEWTSSVRNHLENNFEMYNDAALNNLAHAVGWLGDWACSRTFGLGTKLPWDEQWLIESLSDSTIYMAYYTIAHLLQGTSMNGDQDGPCDIRAEHLTEDVFDYIFCLREDVPENTPIRQDDLDRMRNEFRFWYPMDLRCSGKDLIQNHLTMCLFNHTAIWDDSAFWPRSFFCNGHVMIDSEKMSKSKGNFLTLQESISTYSADATRIVCADSGDTLQDANFSREIAGKTILRLTTLLDWATDAASRATSAMRRGEYTFLDKVFHNEVNSCIEQAHEAYTKMLYSEALRAAWYDMENLRSQYNILACGDVHAEVIQWSLEAQMVVLSPIAPHFCEHVWRNILNKDTLVVHETWPVPQVEFGPIVSRQYECLKASLRFFRVRLDKISAGGKKNKKSKAPKTSAKPARAVIFVASKYQKYQEEVLRLLQEVELDDDNVPKQKDFMRSIATAVSIKAMSKENQKKALPFASFAMKNDVKTRGKEALELQLPFDEKQLLTDVSEVIRSQLGLQSVDIVDAAEDHPDGGERERLAASPGNPQILFVFDVPEDIECMSTAGTSKETDAA